MILQQATLKYKGYDPSTLTKGSHKRVCCSCDLCGRVRYVNYQNYRNLCYLCSIKSIETRKKMSEIKIGKKRSKVTCKNISDGHKGKSQSLESRVKRSCTHQGINIEDFSGFTNKTRSYVLPELQCIKLNNKFNNSHFHHITKSIGIYIPADLHNNINHNIRNGNNMGSIIC